MTTPPQNEPRPHLRRDRNNKVVAGVCGGLGRHFDLDPVIFRVVLGVLAVTGGIGLIFYGFAWLVIQLEGEDENEARRLLTGRVEGASMAAVLFALGGCGLFLSMLHYVSVLVFAALLSLATAGSAVWSERRRLATPEPPEPAAGQRAPAQKPAGQKVADAPPETKAPPRRPARPGGGTRSSRTAPPDRSVPAISGARRTPHRIRRRPAGLPGPPRPRAGGRAVSAAGCSCSP